MTLPEAELAALKASGDAVRAAMEMWSSLAGDDPAGW
jgi:hypothetical protein